MSCAIRASNRIRIGCGLGLLLLLGGAGSSSAWAQAGGAGGTGAGGAGGATSTTPSCADATMFPNPIVLTGSSAFEPTASYFAAKAAALSPPVTVIYNATGSCTGVAAVTGSTRAPLTKTGHVYKTMDAAGKPVQSSCQLDAASAAPIYGDIGVSDVFYESCGLGARPATIGDLQGPVQAMLMIVNAANTGVQALSAEQAAAIWGCGANKVAGFTDDTSAAGIQQRDMNSGTQILIAKNIGVPEGAFKGKSASGSGALADAVAAQAAATTGIGFVAADTYKSKVSAGAAIHSLAFRGLGQTKAFYADSVASAQDRRNVRDGHYVIAGPEHFVVTLTNGAPSAAAQKFIDWVNGNTMVDASASTWIDLEATAGTIPQCAMRVAHTSDGGPMTPYAPAKPCGCYFESKATGMAAPTGCTACSATVPCAGGKTCSYGFCE